MRRNHEQGLIWNFVLKSCHGLCWSAKPSVLPYKPLGRPVGVEERKEFLETLLTCSGLSEYVDIHWHSFWEGCDGLQWCMPLMCLSFILRVTVEESVFWRYWHQYIVTIWVTRQPTDRWGCSVCNAHSPLSSTLGGWGCTPRAGSRSHSWYLTMTHYVLWILPALVPSCSGPNAED